MRFKHQISITGATGVGSSSLMKALQKRLAVQPYRFVSVGALFLQRAHQYGMGKEEFAAHCLAHPEEGHDKYCDDTIAEMARIDWMVCDSRLSHYFMPGAFKALLTCPLEVRARRRHRDFPESSFQSVLEGIHERDRNDNARYASLYPGCLWTPDKFDLVLDSLLSPPEKLADMLLEEHGAWAMDGVRLAHQ